MKVSINKIFFEQVDHFENDFYEKIPEEVIRQEESFGNIYYGRNAAWIGHSGRMIQAFPDYTYPIQGNIFYDSKTNAVKDIIKNSSEIAYFYAPYGEIDIIGLHQIKESQLYGEEDIGHRVWTSGDEELDEYIKNPKEWLEDNFDIEYNLFFDDLIKFAKDEDLNSFKKFLIEEEGYEDEEDFELAFKKLEDLKNLIYEMEDLKKDAVERSRGDIGKISVQIRDGNHRAFGAFEAGEPYVWVMVSERQMQGIKDKDYPELEGLTESLVNGNISNDHIHMVSENFGLNSNIYQIYALVENNPDYNKTEILNKIRAIPNVTVISIVDSTYSNSLSSSENTKIRLKFLASKSSADLILQDIQTLSSKIEGIKSFKFYEESLMMVK